VLFKLTPLLATLYVLLFKKYVHCKKFIFGSLNDININYKKITFWNNSHSFYYI